MDAKQLYVLIMFVVGVVLYFVTNYIIRRVETERREHLEDKSRFEAVGTKTPHKNPLRRARDEAIQSVKVRFTIIRWLFIISLFLIWFIALTFPFLGEMPARVISFGVTATTILIGIAARPFVENLIAGVVISFSDKLRIGDTITLDGEYGTVEDITMSHTVIKLWDWKRFVIPNSQMINRDFLNHSLNDSHIWAYVEFWVALDSNIDQVRQVAIETAKKQQLTEVVEEPGFWVVEMDQLGARCWLAAWVNSPPEAWTYKANLRAALMAEFQEAGIRSHLFRHGL